MKNCRFTPFYGCQPGLVPCFDDMQRRGSLLDFNESTPIFMVARHNPSKCFPVTEPRNRTLMPEMQAIRTNRSTDTL